MRPRLLGGALLGFFLLCTSSVRADERSTQEISIQGTGFFTKNSNGNGINQQTTSAGGLLLSYRYRFHRWLSADVSYGYSRNTQQNLTPGGNFNVQSNVHQATAAAVVSLPWRPARLNPYVLAGTGALVFAPTNNAGGFVPGAGSQSKATFVYGGGADYDLFGHLAIRLEYRGFVYGRPDFGLSSLHSGATTHTAQPSAGFVVRF